MGTNGKVNMKTFLLGFLTIPTMILIICALPVTLFLPLLVANLAFGHKLSVIPGLISLIIWWGFLCGTAMLIEEKNNKPIRRRKVR